MVARRSLSKRRKSRRIYLSKTINLLGELRPLSFDETKETISALILYLTKVSYGLLVHILLWLIANYEIAVHNERIWIRNIIHEMGK